MSHIYTSADQLIGRTPLLELARLEQNEALEARILGKLEYFNPAGSVKDHVLGFVKNDKGIGKRAAAHESQRGDFNFADGQFFVDLFGG